MLVLLVLQLLLLVRVWWGRSSWVVLLTLQDHTACT
jgi:hypothetical protein